MAIDLTFHNWRCFENTKVFLPDHSFALVDQNGSGKTSFLSGLYTLLTKRSWPNTKILDGLKENSQYFGLSTSLTDWSFAGQINPSGKLNTRYQKPNSEFQLLGQSISIQTWPKIITYQPIDNYWFNQSRSQKLATLDIILISIFDQEYEPYLKKLTKNVETKNKVLKHYLETNQKPDSVLMTTLNKEILDLSQKIWTFRCQFFSFLIKSLPEFSKWISSPLKNWKIRYLVSNNFGFREEIDLDSEFKIPDLDFSKLAEKELVVGRTLFGAQRDDFQLEANHLDVSDFLSRGEMRLLVLFIKSLGLGLNLKKPSRYWWFMDDIFNELDSFREKILYQEILQRPSVVITTSTQKANSDLAVYNFKTLTKGIF